MDVGVEEADARAVARDGFAPKEDFARVAGFFGVVASGVSAGSGFNFRFPWASWIVRSTFNRSQPSSIPGVSR